MEFEYLVDDWLADDSDHIQRGLTDMGKDGWELVSYEAIMARFGGSRARLIFKRPKDTP